MPASIPVPNDIREAIDESLATLTRMTGLDAESLFYDRTIEDFATLTGPAAHAAGIIEGAAVALGLTAFELIDLVTHDMEP